MPKKPVLDYVDKYIVLYTVNSNPHWQEYTNPKLAVEGYRMFREYYGDNVRMARIVFDYGKEV